MANKTKKILITGAHGFLGQHLVRELNAHGYKHLLVPAHHELDLMKTSRIRSYLKHHRPQSIIHCAARVGGIGANRRHPGLFLYENLRMGMELMEEARLAGIGKFVCLGTVCSYPKWTPVPFREKNIWSGYPEDTNAPYGLAKKMLLVQGQSYRLQYGFKSVHLIPVNLYGPGDNFDPASSHVIPALLRKVRLAKAQHRPHIRLWGSGAASREFLYVGDCAEAIRLALERYNGSDPVNIGTGSEIRIRDLAKLVCELMEYRGKILWDKTQPDGQPRRSLDTSRAKKEFGFRARTSLRKGLIETIRWYSGRAV